MPEGMEVSFRREERGEPFELPGLGELQVVQQVDDLLERGVSGEILDPVPHVRQGALLAVDVGQVGVGRDDLSEPLVGHDPPFSGDPVPASLPG